MLRLTGIILFSLLLFTNGNAQVKIEKNKKTQQVQQKKELSNQVKRKQELSKTKQAVRMEKPQRTSFALPTKVFCIEDYAEYSFDINPLPKSMEEILNKNDLLMEFRNGALIFQPNRLRIKRSKDFHLMYQDIGLDIKVIVPDASFYFKIEETNISSSPYLLSIQAKNGDASKYEWEIKIGEKIFSLNAYQKEIPISESDLKRLAINLKTSYNLPFGKCQDQKTIQLDIKALLYECLNKGWFDQNKRSIDKPI